MPKKASAKAPKTSPAPVVPRARKEVDVSTNPLKNPDHRFLQQILTKEATKREIFDLKLMTLTRDRNPLLGEETYRENPEFLVANKTKHMSLMKEVADSLRFKSDREEPIGSAVGLVHSLRQRKNIIESELAQMKKIMDHKKLCLSLTSEHSKPRTLHPALEQTSQTTNLNKAILEAKKNKKNNGESRFVFENNAVCEMGR